jgi:membrane-associated protein
MNYAHFLFYNIAGGILWVAIFTGGGYYFGNAPIVRDHFSLVVFAIIFISLVPAAAELWRHYASRTAEKR